MTSTFALEQTVNNRSSGHFKFSDQIRILQESWDELAVQIHNPEDEEVGEILERTSTNYTTDDEAEADQMFVKSYSDSGSSSITMLEKLIRSHPIWFLPGIKAREEITNLLRGKETGTFIVRNSGHTDALCLSVQTGSVLPSQSVQHVLIRRCEGPKPSRMRLDCSERSFDNILSLVYHYQKSRDELPCQLQLPQTIRESCSRQALTSMALLGKDFWRYPMSFPNHGKTKQQIVYSSSTKVSKRSFMDPKPDLLLPPANERAIYEHKSSLRHAQKQSKDARWSASRVRRRAEVTRSALEDTLLDLQEVSNMLDASLNELRTEDEVNPRRSFVSRTSSSRRQSFNNSLQQQTPNPSKLSPSKKHSRKHSAPPTCSSRTSSSYFTSSLADKISDYEDIWQGSGEKTAAETSDYEDVWQISKVNMRNTRSMTPSKSKTQEFLNENVTANSNYDNHQPREETSISKAVFLSSSSLSSSPTTSSTSSSSETSSSSSPLNTGMDLNSIYSDPLDALEKADDTRIYNCPEFGLSSETPESGTVEAISTVKRLSDANMNWITEKTPEETYREKDHIVKKKKNQVVLRSRSNAEMFENKSAKGDVNRRSQHRLSAVIGRYIRPPKSLVGAPSGGNGTSIVSKASWQVDSSSWEFLGRESDADSESSEENSSNSENDRQTSVATSKPRKDTPKTFSESPLNGTTSKNALNMGKDKDSSYESGNNDTMNTSMLVKNEIKDIGIPNLLQQPSSECRERIRNCVMNLAGEESGIFSMNISKFVQCTEESSEKNPYVVMRNMRQFMNGIKNYLIRNGEGQLHLVIDEERAKLKSHEFLNVDSILEECLHALVVQPLQDHLEQLLKEDFIQSGCLESLSQSLKMSRRKKSPDDFQIPKAFQPRLTETVAKSREELLRLRNTYSPVQKLDALLTIINIILGSSNDPKTPVSVEDFCSLLAYVLVQSGTGEWIEMEIEQMWGLLHPSLLSGEGGYYMAMLSSTIHFLKAIETETDIDQAPSVVSSDPALTAKKINNGSSWQNSWRSNVSASTAASQSSPDSRVKILIPNDINGSIMSEMFPTRPRMHVKALVKLVAHKMKVTNPEDFALFKLIDGKETLLSGEQRSDEVMKDEQGNLKPVVLVYKRKDAVIAWPKDIQVHE